MIVFDYIIVTFICFQMFAVDLVSHLSLQYALPKSLSVARLAISTLTTLLTGTNTYMSLSRITCRNLQCYT